MRYVATSITYMTPGFVGEGDDLDDLKRRALEHCQFIVKTPVPMAPKVVITEYGNGAPWKTLTGWFSFGTGDRMEWEDEWDVVDERWLHGPDWVPERG